MLPFFAWKIFSISFFISLDFYLQVLLKRKDICFWLLKTLRMKFVLQSFFIRVFARMSI